MRVLGIETSCDETSVAIYDEKAGLLAHHIYSQTELHAQYGGVVPELASRDHISKLLPLVRQSMADASYSPEDLTGIVYTAGPGLVGALLVGACLATSLAYGWNLPVLGVNHLEGHVLAAMLEENRPEYPFTSLLVSGGHTALIEVSAPGSYKILGETIDDAVGEAFDKTAKQLGLPYPGGAALAKLAEKAELGNFRFTRPMPEGLNFSFSGLKTQALLTIQAQSNSDHFAEIAAAFQETVVDTLVMKCERALKQTGHSRLVIAGGVGANQRLREKLKSNLSKNNIEVFYPRQLFCTDNAAMIAYAGYLRLKAGERDTELHVHPRWSLEELKEIELPIEM